MRFETSVEARDTDEGGKVYDAICTDTALDEPCFRSVGWSSEAQARVRVKEHSYEHVELVPIRELEAFRKNVSTEEYEAHVVELLEKNALPEPRKTGGDK